MYVGYYRKSRNVPSGAYPKVGLDGDFGPQAGCSRPFKPPCMVTPVDPQKEIIYFSSRARDDLKFGRPNFPLPLGPGLRPAIFPLLDAFPAHPGASL